MTRAVALVLLLAALGCRAPVPPPSIAQVSDAEAARIPGLEEVCAGADTRADRDLCALLRAAETSQAAEARGHYARARRLVRERFARDPEAAAASAPARYWLRERVVALLAWHALGAPVRFPPDWPARAGAELGEHFPLYPPERFHLARVGLVPDLPGCDGRRATLLLFPGVVRLVDRDEFAVQRDALRRAVPCLHTAVVDTLTFVTAERNAQAGCAALREASAAAPGAPVHLLGYSQGARNALETLLACPEAAGSVRSLLALNSAARGSELGDVASLVLPLPELEDERCARFGWLRGWWCRRNPVPGKFGALLAPAVALALGVPLEDAGAFLAAEGFDGDLDDFLRERIAGLRSLSTYEAQGFWLGPAGALPRRLLVLTFRAIVTDPGRNLPKSNALFYHLIRRTGGTHPQNDMQVRLLNQRLGGPLAEREVLGPVAEGNHWQWELNEGDVPEYVMPGSMLEGIPRAELLLALVQALHEIERLLGPAGAGPGPTGPVSRPRPSVDTPR